MKKNEWPRIIMLVFIVGLITFILTLKLFNVKPGSVNVPVVEALPRDFPDVKNDPRYQSFLNDKALDPTQPIQIGNGGNNAPFSGQ